MRAEPNNLLSVVNWWLRSCVSNQYLKTQSCNSIGHHNCTGHMSTLWSSEVDKLPCAHWVQLHESSWKHHENIPPHIHHMHSLHLPLRPITSQYDLMCKHAAVSHSSSHLPTSPMTRTTQHICLIQHWADVHHIMHYPGITLSWINQVNISVKQQEMILDGNTLKLMNLCERFRRLAVQHNLFLLLLAMLVEQTQTLNPTLFLQVISHGVELSHRSLKHIGQVCWINCYLNLWRSAEH